MLRVLVLILFLANLLFYLWTQGALVGAVDVQPGGQHEPDRMSHQVHPNVIRVLPPESASAAASGAEVPDAAASTASAASGVDLASASAASGSASSAGASEAYSCLEAGPYTLAERIQVEAKLKSILKPGDWMDRTRERPAGWMVYMGRYASEDLLGKKEEELRRIKIDYTVVRSPADLMWGLSLGRYDQRNEADAALARVAQRGVRTARLVSLSPDIAHWLRLPRVNPALETTLAGVPATVWLERSLKPCGAGLAEP